MDVNLDIHRGEYVSIMGPSGSGKSTLLNMLGALDSPTSGEIYFEGQPISTIRNLDRLRAQKVGFVFQSFYLLPVLTAVENVQVPMFEGTPAGFGTRRRRPSSCSTSSAWATASITCREQLSVGERQRVAIARALANDPVVAAGRRADRQSRLEVGHGHLRPLRPAAPRARHDDRADHARRRLGPAGRADRADAGRADEVGHSGPRHPAAAPPSGGNGAATPIAPAVVTSVPMSNLGNGPGPAARPRACAPFAVQ